MHSGNEKDPTVRTYHIKLILEKASVMQSEGAQLDLDQVVAENTSLLWDMH